MKTKTSRRVALVGDIVPMLSTPSATGSNKSDPVFAAIEKHRAAWRKADTLSKIYLVREEVTSTLRQEQSSNPSRTKNIQ